MQNLPLSFAGRMGPQALCAVAAGILYAASFAPTAWWPMQFAALAIFQLCLLGTRNHKYPLQSAAILAFLFGGVAYGMGSLWIYDALHQYGGQSVFVASICTVVFVVYLSSYVAVAGMAAAWVRIATSKDFWALAAFTSAWVFGDWMRSQLWGGYTLGVAGYAHVEGWLAGYAPILGVYGLTLICLLLSAALIFALFHAHIPYRLIAVLLIFGVLIIGIGLSRLEWTVPYGKPISFRLLQGNISQAAKFDKKERDRTLEIYKGLMLEKAADFIVTPETALPLFLDELPEDYLPSMERFADATKSTVALGIPLIAPNGSAYNSMLAMSSTSRNGTMMRYDKIHLSPVGEYAPFGLGWLAKNVAIPLKDLSPGQAYQEPFRIKDQTLGITICHEDLFGEELAARLHGVSILINASNFAWFEGSLAFWQRIQVSQMRALELGRPVLRVANTGTTALINEKGRIIRQLPEFQRGSLEGQVQGRQGTTPYATWGNGPTLIIVALLGLMSLLAARHAFTQKQANHS